MNTRSRHRLEWERSLAGLRPLEAVFGSYEFFYDWERRRNSEHRLVPLGLGFRLAGSVSLKAYYLWQHAGARAGWLTTHNLYTVFYVTFK